MAEQPRALLVDFGSTFTKLRVVDLDRGALLASVQTPSTVGTSVMDGLRTGVNAISRELGVDNLDSYVKLASSSAAGGLRIVAIGLVPDLTAEAARRAGLGAGGKIIASFANGLTARNMAELARLSPDMIILAGGTNGGDKDCIVGNARILAAAHVSCPVVVAGNRNAEDEVAEILGEAAVTFSIVDNVLPSLNTIDIKGCSEAIRKLFMERIVQSKGLGEAEGYVGQILMPTPHAVLLGFELLCRGTRSQRGLGELVAVDVGGATTDVYSAARGAPTDCNTAVHGLLEPFLKRTVEGDLGLRINAPSIVAAVGSALKNHLDADIDVTSYAERLTLDPSFLPDSKAARNADLALARSAVRIALRRHAGTLDLAHGPEGPFSVQTGKDLRGVRSLIGTGGIFVAHPNAAPTLFADGRYDPANPRHLLPEAPACMIDTNYVMYAVGLLAARAPEAALRLGLDSIGSVASPTH
jgi:uncharacterized protein (TIGR01319 family)